MVLKANELKNEKKFKHQDLALKIQEETKKDLLKNVAIKAEEVSKELEKVLKDTPKGLIATQIFDLITNRCTSSIDVISRKSYTPEELAIAFKIYKDMIAKINEKVLFPPNKTSFCQLLGISTTTYNNYKQDPDKAEIMQIIDDYILGNILTSAQIGQLEKITSIFVSKAQHGLVEATTPIVIEHKKEQNIDAIKKRIAEINGEVFEASYEEKD